MSTKSEIRDKLLKALETAIDLKQFHIADQIATTLMKLDRIT